MKKIKNYLTILAVLFTVIMSSCSNDDIPVIRKVTFKLNPATVVENLFELNAGDLTSLSSGATLNVCLYVYDESGHLAAQDMQEFGAYTHIMTSNLNLGKGTYTAIALSYVSSSVEYWGFSGMENLSTFKITDEHYVGGKLKILGLTVKQVSVTEGDNTINIDIENAGAVACVGITNWNRYNDVKYFGLLGKQACDYITTNNYGDVEYSIRSKNDYGFYKVKYEYNSNRTGETSYFFTFPIKNAAMKFFAETTSGSVNYLGSDLVDDIKLGDSYLIVYDVTSEETEWWDMTPDSRSTGRGKLSDEGQANKPQPVYDYVNHTIVIR